MIFSQYIPVWSYWLQNIEVLPSLPLPCHLNASRYHCWPGLSFPESIWIPTISQLKDQWLVQQGALRTLLQPCGWGSLVEVSILTDRDLCSVTVQYFDNHP